MSLCRIALGINWRQLEVRINCSGMVLTVTDARDYDPNRNLALQETVPIASTLRAHLKTAMEHNISSNGADIDTIVFNTDPSQGADFSNPSTVISLRASLGGTYDDNPAPQMDTYLPITRSVVIRGPRVAENDPSLPLVNINWNGYSWFNEESFNPIGWGSDWSVIQIFPEVFEGHVTLEGLKISGGQAQDGAGIYVSTRGGFHVNIFNCEISNNVSKRDDLDAGTNGAGIFMASDTFWAEPSTLTIGGSIIRNNATDFNDMTEDPGVDVGAGIYVGGGTSLVMAATIVENNVAENGGGGLYFVGTQQLFIFPTQFIYSTDLRIGGCAFFENEAKSPNSSSSGGAMIIGGGMNGMVSDTTFADNSATGSGGAVYISDGGNWDLVGEVNFVACTFTDNNAAIVPDFPPDDPRSWGSGGALHVNSTANEVFIVNSTFSENRAEVGEGGAIAIMPWEFDYRHRIVFTKSYDARFLGFDPDQTIDSPVYQTGKSRVEIRNSTIADNFAGGQIGPNADNTQNISYGARGGGIAVFTSEADDYELKGTVVINSTIVAENTIGLAPNSTPISGSAPDIWVADDTVTVVGPIPLTGDHNLIGVRGDTTAGSGHFLLGGQKGTLAAPLDPLLGPLAGNGGMTLTRAITPSSPAYNNGAPTFNNGTATPYMTLDQRFGARKIGSEVDVGAYEWQVTVKSIKIDNGDIATYGPTAENSNQRSEVRRIIVTFSEPVNFTGASAFKLHRDQVNSKQAGPDLDVALVTSPVAGVATTVTVTFTNSPGFVTLDPGASVPDGLYDFTIIAANVTVGGVGLNGNGFADGTDFVEDSHYEGNQPDGIWRIFGDGDGTGISDLTDFAAFRTLFNLGANAIFDFDNDGNVGLSDFAAFITRFNLTP